MSKKQRFSAPAIGGSSLLVIFAVLCLTVFALLSLNTVLAEQRIADASVRAVREYYEADLQAERIFARLRAGETVAGVQTDGSFFAYSCPITENRILEVELRKDGDRWHICRWQVVAHSQPISETLPVWDGT